MTGPTDDEDLKAARALRRTGADEAAMARYLTLLRREPTHFHALIELGELAYATGHRSAARTAYEQAVATHPTEALGHVNLANVLAVSDEAAAAKAHFEAALVLRPDLPAAHRGLALIAAEEGDLTAAREHGRSGFAPEPIVDKPFRGTGSAPRILMLVSARGGNIPADLWLNDRRFHLTALYADYADLAAPLPPHDLLFNTIGDADLCGEALAAAQVLVARTDRPVLNPPDRIVATGRVATAGRLRGLPHVVTPATILRSIAELRTAEAIVFPMLLRRPGYHTGRHFHRIETRVGFISALDTFAGDGATDLLAIDYLDARGADGRARKYRVMFIGGRLYPLHLAISNDWKVHYFTSAMADDAAFRAEEAAFLDDPEAVVGAAGWAALGEISATLGLDYGGIDFGLDGDGRILVFEANATMVLIPPGPEPQWTYRRPAIGRAIRAVEDLLRETLKTGLPESRRYGQTSAA